MLLKTKKKEAMYYYQDSNSDIVFVEEEELLPQWVKEEGCHSIYLSDYFENDKHFANFCMKIIRDRFPDLELPDDIWYKLRSIYTAYDYNTYAVNGNICSPPAERLSYKIKETTNVRNLVDLLDRYLMALEENRLHNMNPPNHITFGAFGLDDLRGGVDLDCDIDLRRCGVYFLYNSSKDLIYVGKSNNLLGRIYDSAKDRMAKYCRFGFTETKVGAGIYEIYYIAKCDPPLNKQYSSHKEPEIELPELELTEYYKFEYKK